jgi:hypothetical protein
MKFLNDLDAQRFCVEIGRLDLVDSVTESFVPEQDMLVEFITRRKGLVKSLKSFRRSQSTKASWRSNRYQFMQGIRKFHKSTQGKRFHREMGRFLATRFTGDKSQDRKVASEVLSVYEAGAALKALSSMKTHCFISLEYFHPLEEEVALWEFLEALVPVIASVEAKVLEERLGEVTDDEYDILLRTVDPLALKIMYAEAMGTIPPGEGHEFIWKNHGGEVVERHTKVWGNAVKNATKNLKEEDDGFFLRVVEDYCRMLKMKNEPRKPRHLPHAPVTKSA